LQLYVTTFLQLFENINEYLCFSTAVKY